MNRIWTLVDQPKDRPVIGSKWVFIKKYHADGCFKHYKGCLIVQGFSQHPGFKYLEVFAPTAKRHGGNVEYLGFCCSTPSNSWILGNSRQWGAALGLKYHIDVTDIIFYPIFPLFSLIFPAFLCTLMLAFRLSHSAHAAIILSYRHFVISPSTWLIGMFPWSKSLHRLPLPIFISILCKAVLNYWTLLFYVVVMP